MYEEYEYQEPSLKDSLYIWSVLWLCLVVWGVGVALIVRYHEEIWMLMRMVK